MFGFVFPAPPESLFTINLFLTDSYGHFTFSKLGLFFHFLLATENTENGEFLYDFKLPARDRRLALNWVCFLKLNTNSHSLP